MNVNNVKTDTCYGRSHFIYRPKIYTQEKVINKAILLKNSEQYKKCSKHEESITYKAYSIALFITTISVDTTVVERIFFKMQYQGQIVDGQMHGSGKLTYENGEFYDGDWVRGLNF